MKAQHGKVVILALTTILFLAVLGAGCGGGDGDKEKDWSKEPYGPPSKTVKVTYTGTMPGDPSVGGQYTLVVDGTKEIAGKTYDVYKAVPNGIEPAKPPFEAYLDLSDPGKVVLAGVSHLSVADITITGDAPYTADVFPPKGVDQAISVSATATLPGDSTPRAGTITGTYALVDDNASVETDSMGVISGVNYYKGKGKAEGEGVPEYVFSIPVRGVEAEAEVWYDPDTKLLIAARIPAIPFVFGLKNVMDYGDATEGFNTIKGMGTLGPGNPNFRLSTYDVHGQFDADKFTHAQMLVELRWADEEWAKTDNAPNIGNQYLFLGDMGYFPYQLTKSPVSLFHPKENGAGFTYWYAFVSQALKNVPGDNGSSYSIEISNYDASLNSGHNLRITARIHYKLYAP